jgi:outer membrane immunogenic protein
MDMLRRGTIGLLSLASVGLTTSVAMADDGTTWGATPGYYERPSIWRGLYAGVHLGFGSSGDLDGVVGGGQIGYNWQSKQIVYGLEVDASLADISGGSSVSFAGMTASANASIDWMMTVRGRLGVLLTPRVLAYGTAGFGIAGSSWDARAGGFGFGIQQSGSDTSTGFAYGVGLEGKFTDSMSARIEYVALTGLDGTISSDGVGVVRAGLNFKLGQ